MGDNRCIQMLKKNIGQERYILKLQKKRTKTETGKNKLEIMEHSRSTFPLTSRWLNREGKKVS